MVNFIARLGAGIFPHMVSRRYSTVALSWWGKRQSGVRNVWGVGIMEKYAVYVPKLVDKEENFAPGHRACVGCGEVLAVRQACKALGNNIIVVNATGCMIAISAGLPYTSWRVPWIHTLFENTAAVASGVEAALKSLSIKGKRDTGGTKAVVPTISSTAGPSSLQFAGSLSPS